jgi:hypothetical protein
MGHVATASQRGECASASRTEQPQGTTTGEKEAGGIRMGDFLINSRAKRAAG